MMNRFSKVMIGLVCFQGSRPRNAEAAQAAGGMAPPGVHGMRPGGPAQPGHGSPIFGGVRLTHRDGNRFHGGWSEPFLGGAYVEFSGTYAAESWASQTSPGAVILMAQPAAAPAPEPAPPPPARAARSNLRRSIEKPHAGRTPEIFCSERPEPAGAAIRLIETYREKML